MKDRYIKINTIMLIGALCFCLSGCNTLGDKTTSMSVIYGATTVVSFLLLLACTNILRKRDLWFFLLFGSVLVVNIGYFCLSVSHNLEEALLANRFAYLGSVCLPFSMMMIILHVTNIKYQKWLPIFLSMVSAFVFFVAASPGYLTIYYKEVTYAVVNGVTVLQKVYGPWHKLYAVFLLGYFAAMVAIIIYASLKKKMQSASHAVILATAVFANIIIWMLEQLIDLDFEFLSVSYIISEMFLLGLYIMMQDEERKIETLIAKSHNTANVRLPVENEQLELFRMGLDTLTKTERMIYDYYLVGKTTTEVLELLNIKENTLKFHNKNLYSKLGVSSRKQLKEISKELMHKHE